MRARRWRGGAAVLAAGTVLVFSQPGALAATPVKLEVALHVYVGQFSSAAATKVVLLVSDRLCRWLRQRQQRGGGLGGGQGGGRSGSLDTWPALSPRPATTRRGRAVSSPSPGACPRPLWLSRLTPRPASLSSNVCVGASLLSAGARSPTECYRLAPSYVGGDYVRGMPVKRHSSAVVAHSSYWGSAWDAASWTS